ncbi:MAG: hypothetical protein KBT63_02950 [Porticoccaceae bacterium]|nr:hypothetical protein [Porticoccaceae bacterium]
MGEFLMVIFIAVGLAVVLIAVAVWWDASAKKTALAQIELATQETGYSFSRADYGHRNKAIGADANAGYLCLVYKEAGSFIRRTLPLADVVSSQIQSDNIVLVDAQRKSGLGRAVVGGALFGGAGAVAGAITGSGTTAAVEETVYELHLTINDLSNPHFFVTFTDFAKAKEWQSFFEVALR